MKKPFIITVKTKIRVQLIFSFDNHEQQMWECTIKELPLEWKESDLIRNLIENAFPNDIENTKDLVKISMCINGDKASTKVPCIKQMLKRNGKYFFQPDQRDHVENAIIKDSVIASLTKPFSELKVS